MSPMALVDTIIELEENELVGCRQPSLLALQLARYWQRNPLTNEVILAK